MVLKGICLLLVVALGALGVSAQKTVSYRVEYSQTNGPCDGTNLEPLNLTAPDFSTARDIVELGAREGGRDYQFSASFSDQDGVVDYIIDAINGTRATAPCSWEFYVQAGDAEMMPDIGISSYIPGNDFDVILRYESEVAEVTVTTTYAIEYPDPVVCAPQGGGNPQPPGEIRVTTSEGSTALDVMEEAVAQGGRAYQFSVNYVSFAGNSFGYAIDQVNGVGPNGSCSWFVFVRAPGGSETMLTMGVSEYSIPGDGYSLSLRYMEPEVPTPMSTTSSAKGLKTADTAVLLLSCASLAILYLTSN